MDKLSDILNALQQYGVRLSLLETNHDGNESSRDTSDADDQQSAAYQLKLLGDKTQLAQLPEDLLASVKAHKSDIIALLINAQSADEKSSNSGSVNGHDKKVIAPGTAFPLSSAQRAIVLHEQTLSDNEGLAADDTSALIYQLPLLIKVNKSFSLHTIRMFITHWLEKTPLLQSALLQHDQHFSLIYKGNKALLKKLDAQVELPSFSVQAIKAFYQKSFSIKHKHKALFDLQIFDAEDTYAIAFKIHHCICDAHSAQLLIQGLSQYFELNGELIGAPVSPDICYFDYLLDDVSKNINPSSSTNTSALFDDAVRNAEPLWEALRWTQNFNTSQSQNVSDFQRIQSALALLMSKFYQKDQLTVFSASDARLENKQYQYATTVGLFTRFKPHQYQTSEPLYQAIPKVTHITEAELSLSYLRRSDDSGKDLSANKTAYSWGEIYSHEALIELLGESPSGDVRVAEQTALTLAPFNLRVDHHPKAEQLHLSLICDTSVVSGTLLHNFQVLFDQALAYVSEKSQQSFSEALLGFQFPSKLQAVSLHDDAVIKRYCESHFKRGNINTPLAAFYQTAMKQPHSIAIRSNNQAYTYEKLLGDVNVLAAYLDSQQLDKTDEKAVIGVSCLRDYDSYVAILACHLVDVAYVPLHPAWPEERLDDVLSRVHCQCLLTSDDEANSLLIKAVKENTQLSNNVSVATLIQNANSIEHPSRLKARACESKKNDFAILFSSGTTANPKAIRISHAGIFSRLVWMADRFNDEQTQSLPLKVLQKTSLSFDVSIWEIYLPLITGGELIVCGNGKEADADYLSMLIEKYQIDLLHFVPSVFEAVSASLVENQSLNAVVFSGEELKVHQASKAQQLFSHAKVLNFYGPTEASIDVSTFEHQEAIHYATNSVPIGKASPGVELYVLDEHQQLLTQGQVGELYIGGMQVSSGYFDNTALNKKAFIDNPVVFEDNHFQSTRLYKTGDWVYQNAEGDFVFCGRVDNQVKINGKRFELDYLNEAVSNYFSENNQFSVKSARAILVKEQYIVLIVELYDVDSCVDDKDLLSCLHEYLRNRVEADFFPRRLFTVDAWPLTLHGKLDAKALATWAEQSLKSSNVSGFQDVNGVQNQLSQENANQVLPQQKNVANVFLQALKQGFIQLQSADLSLAQFDQASFIELGGHSLIAMDINQQLYQTYGKAIDIQAFFNASTLSELIQDYCNDLLDDDVIFDVLKSKAVTALEALTQSQQQILRFASLFPNSTAYVMNVAFILEPQSGQAIESWEEKLKSSFARLVKRFNLLQRHYHADYGFAAVDDLDKAIDSAFVRFGRVSARMKTDFLLTRDAEPLDIARQLPIRLSLAPFKSSFIVHLSVHHIVADAFSIRSLYQALIAYLSNDEIVLDHTLNNDNNFDDFAFSLNQAAENKEAISAYETYLSSVAIKSQLPGISFDQPIDAKDLTQPNASLHRFSLNKNTTQRLIDFANVHQVSVYDALLYCYQRFLHQLCDVSPSIALLKNLKPSSYHQEIGLYTQTYLLHADSSLQDVDAFKHTLRKLQSLLPVNIESIIQGKTAERKNYLPFTQYGFNFLESLQGFEGSIEIPNARLQVIDAQPSYAKNALILSSAIEAGEADDGQTIAAAFEFNTWFFDKAYVEQLSRGLCAFINAVEIDKLAEEADITSFNEQDFFTSLQNQLLAIAREKVQYHGLNANQLDIATAELFEHRPEQNHIGFITHSHTYLDEDLWRESIALVKDNFPYLGALLDHQGGQMLWAITQQINAGQSSLLPYNAENIDDVAYDEAFKLRIMYDCIEPAFTSGSLLWRARRYIWPDQQQSVFVFVCHHALLDGVSMQIVGQHIKDTYQALLENKKEEEGNKKEISDIALPEFADTFLQGSARDVFNSPNDRRILHESIRDVQRLRFDVNKNADALLTTQPIKCMRQLSVDDSLQFQLLCKKLRTTPAALLKSIFSLSIYAAHQRPQSFLLQEVVAGRDKSQFTDLGVCFQEQVNIIDASMTQAESFSQWLKANKAGRKHPINQAKLSLSAIRRTLNQPFYYLFNFYIMETETQFLGGKEHVEHIMPSPEGACNLVGVIHQAGLQLNWFFPKGFPADAFQHQFDDVLDQLLLALKNDALPSLLLTSVLSKPALFEPSQHDYLESASSSTNDIDDQSVIQGDALSHAIKTVWKDVLQLSQLGIHDNFFLLGGNSLQALSIAQKLKAQGIFVKPEQLLLQPSIASITEAIANQQAYLSQTFLPFSQALIESPSSGGVLGDHLQRLFVLEKLGVAIPCIRLPVDLTTLIHALQAVTLGDDVFDDEQFDTFLSESGEIQTVIKALVTKHEALRYRLVEPESGQDYTLEFFDINHGFVEFVSMSPEAMSTFMQSQNMTMSAGKPLFKVFINRYEESSSLCLMMHHAVFDAKSLEIIAKDIQLLLQRVMNKQVIELLPSTYTYADWQQWQSAIKSHEGYQQGLHYWQEKLQYAPSERLFDTLHETSHSSKKVFDTSDQHSVKSNVQTLLLKASEREKLSKQARAIGVSMQSLLLTVFALSLYSSFKKTNFTLGLPRDGRSDEAFDDVVGFFVNVLIARFYFSHSASLTQTLQAVHQELMQSIQYDFVSPNDVLNLLPQFRGLDDIPFAQCAFNYTFYQPLNTPHMGGLDETFDEAFVSLNDIRPSLFDVQLSLHDTTETLHVHLQYDAVRLDVDEVDAVWSSFSHWLVVLARDDVFDQAIYRLAPEGGERDLSVLLPLYQSPLQPSCQPAVLPSTLPSLFESFLIQAEKNIEREAIAVCVHSSKNAVNAVSYRDFCQRIVQWLGFLESFELHHNDGIGLAMTMSVDRIALHFALGINGLHYLDLTQYSESIDTDVESIQHRFDLALVIGDSAVETYQKIFDNDNDNDNDVITALSDLKSRLANPNSSSLAYKIQSSGTTGAKKTAAISTHSFNRLVCHYIAKLNLNERSQGLLLSASEFDLSQKNIFAVLAAGGCLHIVDNFKSDFVGLNHAAQMINAYACENDCFDYINLTPSAAQILLPQLDSIHAIKHWVLGGEAIPKPLLSSLIDAKVKVSNTYGPNECTDVVAWHTFNEDEEFIGRGVNQSNVMGDCFASNTLLIIDTNKAIQPEGEYGRLAIAGPQLLRAYVDEGKYNISQAFTAMDLSSYGLSEKEPVFITDDVVVMRNKQLHFIQRQGNEVKRLGQFIDLQVLADTVKAHCGFAFTHAAITDDQLVLFYQVKGSSKASQDWLRTFNELATIQKPDKLIEINEVLYTSNGKIDAKALLERFDSSEILVEKETIDIGLANDLTDIWLDVLPVDRLLVSDNFFELGGDSLKAIQAIDKIEQHFDISVEPLQWFSANTIQKQVVLLNEVLNLRSDTSPIDREWYTHAWGLEQIQEPLLINTKAQATSLYIFTGFTLDNSEWQSHIPKLLTQYDIVYWLDLNKLIHLSMSDQSGQKGDVYLDFCHSLDQCGQAHFVAHSISGIAVLALIQSLQCDVKLSLLDCFLPSWLPSSINKSDFSKLSPSWSQSLLSHQEYFMSLEGELKKSPVVLSSCEFIEAKQGNLLMQLGVNMKQLVSCDRGWGNLVNISEKQSFPVLHEGLLAFYLHTLNTNP